MHIEPSTEHDMSKMPADLVTATKDIVAAYVQHNAITADGVPAFIEAVHKSMVRISGAVADVDETEEVAQTPAVSVKKSVHEDYLICLEDGKKLKVMTRYLRTHHNMSPEEYRRKWNLPHDYPMTAPGYSKKRSEMAHSMGLGRQRKKTVTRKSAPRSETLSKEA